MPPFPEAAPQGRHSFYASSLTWSAIFAGVAITLAVELLFALLGAGVGLSLVHPDATSGPSPSGFGVGAVLWWALSTVVSLGAGSYGAVRASAVERPFSGAAHGLIIWAVTLLLTLYLLTSAIGGVVGGAFRTIGGLASAAGGSVSAVAPTVAHAAGVSDGDVDDQIAALIQPSPTDLSTMTPEQSRKAILVELPAIAAGGEKGAAAENRIADIISAQDKVSHQEALARVEKARQSVLAAKNDAVAKAKAVTSDGAGMAAGTSFTALLVLLLGAAAAAFGGIFATRRANF